ncbi:ABC transporter substrate-binding protein [Cohnella herbarum]|uniref:ABC transporter substrate-binding protein n=1 Tax=Cohnella herbarum TaxID=2728023 RepID=A0A7Z2VL12_9BACL|nr:ABC transporter substrate-binding protein [Cohnella herbarum]QJD85022.1 ABC transporter substrate-binding protein [Cohnella herbarum]
MNRNKVLSLLLSVVMLMSVLVACSSKNNEGGQPSNSPAAASDDSANQSANASADDATKDPYEITMAIPAFEAVPKDVALIEEEINKITQPKINATVKLLPISIGAWQQQLNLMTSGGEKLDMFFEFGQAYSRDVTSGKIIALDELLDEYGQDLKAEFDSAFLDAAKVDGKVYGVPNLGDSTTGQSGIMMRKDLVEKYNIDVASIDSIDDLDQVFATIKQNEPNITPLAVGLSTPIDKYHPYDPIGPGVLPDYGNDLKLENLYELPWYEDTLKKIHSWFKAGYINKDAATSNVTGSDFVKAGNAFSYFWANQVGHVQSESQQIGKGLVFAGLLPGNYITTGKIITGLWAISQNSENPERAMMFMNLMYTDPALANLLMWGVEGKHYVKVADNLVDYPEGITRETVGWTNQTWLIGNPFNTYLYKTEDPNKWSLTREANQKAIKSKALGFSFNSEPVKNEMTAVTNVITQYRKALESGTVDPDKKLQEFRDKLRAAGIDKIIAEEQNQLDKWAVAK